MSLQQAGLEKPTDALKTASSLVDVQQQELRALLERVSQQMVAHLAELRRVRVESSELAGSIAELETSLAKRRTSEVAVEIMALREQQQGWRQQEERLLDRLEDWRGCSRRLQLALQTGEAVAAALLPEAPVPETGLLGSAAWRVAQAQEDERQRLSREIHDGPAQALANVIFGLEFCERLLDRDPEKLREELRRLKADMRQSLADVRHFIFGLRPAGLAELGLAATVRRYAEDFAARCGISVAIDVDESARLSPNQEVAVFRIIQEALQNTRKHGRASEVRLRLRAQGERLVVHIVDNGEGFDLGKTRSKAIGHFGLRGMQERAQLIGAKLEIDSQPGSGTQITIVVPRQSCDHGS